MKQPKIAIAEPLTHVDRVFVKYRRRKLIYFGGCDYFRLSSHPRVLRAAERVLKTEAPNVSASRVTTGNHWRYEKLEGALRAFFKVEEALLVSTGYAASLVVGQALAGQFSHAVIDEQAHPSLKNAARFLDCPVLQYKHRDAAHAAHTISRCGPAARVILLSDGVFAHDGSLAPLPQLLESLPRDGLVLLDDAHGAGVIGAHGRGTVEYFGIRDKRIVRAITLSKAFGAFGGAVLATRQLCSAIVTKSELFIGSTPIPLPSAAAAWEAAVILATDELMRARLLRNMRLIGKEFPIFSVTPRTRAETANLKGRLIKAGIFPSFIRYPGGPAAGYFRFAISSEHTPKQIKLLLSALEAD